MCGWVSPWIPSAESARDGVRGTLSKKERQRRGSEAEEESVTERAGRSRERGRRGETRSEVNAEGRQGGGV